MKKSVVLWFTFVVVLGFGATTKAQSRIDEIVDKARSQTRLADEVRFLQNTTRTYCVKDLTDESLQKCKDALEILSMDIELIDTLYRVNARGVNIFLSNHVHAITLENGYIKIPLRASIPQIREYFGLEPFSIADYLDREFMVERWNATRACVVENRPCQ